MKLGGAAVLGMRQVKGTLRPLANKANRAVKSTDRSGKLRLIDAGEVEGSRLLVQKTNSQDL